MAGVVLKGLQVLYNLTKKRKVYLGCGSSSYIQRGEDWVSIELATEKQGQKMGGETGGSSAHFIVTI